MAQYDTGEEGVVTSPDAVGKVESKTADEMKSDAFVALLNKYIDDNSDTTSNYIKWKKTDTYPTFESEIGCTTIEE